MTLELLSLYNTIVETIKNTSSNNLFDTSIDGKVGALKSAYLKNLAELVTGKSIEELSDEEEPDRIIGSNYHYPRNKEVSEYFSGLMKDRVVLDLGCGVQATGYIIADSSKAKKYVGVEKNFGKTALERISLAAIGNSTPFEVIQEDMLNYVQDPSHKADIIILVGVDLVIIPERHWQILLQGIHKTMTENGRLLIGGGSTKPWNVIEKYFTKDDSLEEIERKDMNLMSAGLPSIWKKR